MQYNMYCIENRIIKFHNFILIRKNLRLEKKTYFNYWRFGRNYK